MDTRDEKVEAKGWERGEHSLYECFAATAMFLAGPVHPMQQLGGRDRGDSNFLVLA